MAKRNIEQVIVRHGSYVRSKPVVEKIKRRTAASRDGKTVLLCSLCGAKMKLVQTISKLGGPPKLTASCSYCGGVTIKENK